MMTDIGLFLIVIATAVAVLALAWWIRATLARAGSTADREQSMLLLQNQVNALAQQTGQQMDQLRQALQQINQHMAQSLDSTRKTLDAQLKDASGVMQNVNRQLVSLEKSSQQIFDVGKDIAGLQQLLQSPKMRGNLGEFLLGDLLAQVLPPNSYAIQYAFKGNETVDAIIRLQSGLVPVDAKFPMENFKRMSEMTDEREAKAARRLFMRDVKNHVDAIASKYIRPDEGTFDFALMYIPAENVYYEIIIRDDRPGEDKSLLAHALGRKVIPVSPSSFYAYLQTVLLGLKGMEVEKGARDIMNHLSRLRREFAAFEEDFRKVGVHIDNSAKKYVDAEKRLARIDGKMEQMDGLASVSEPEEDLPEQRSTGT
jgi:DNA recombination protein RmuC